MFFFILTFTLSTSSHICEISLSLSELNNRLSNKVIIRVTNTEQKPKVFTSVCMYTSCGWLAFRSWCCRKSLSWGNWKSRLHVRPVAFLTVTSLFLLEIFHICDCNLSQRHLCIRSDSFQRQKAHLIPIWAQRGPEWNTWWFTSLSWFLPLSCFFNDGVFLSYFGVWLEETTWLCVSSVFHVYPK